jgi:[protein-PII] uridylyltransferase
MTAVDLDPPVGTPLGPQWCAARTEAVDRWLAGLLDVAVEDQRGVALLAVGGYGRGDLCPYSDLDVLLLHTGRSASGADIAKVAERIWYPVWDQGTKLGHSVRTVKEAVKLASDDLETATSLLEARCVAGDEALAGELIEKAAEQWRKRPKRWLRVLGEGVATRHQRAGEVAFLLEPDLKEGRGGLRDVHSLRWAEAARGILLPGDDESLAAAHDQLLAVRIALHLVVDRPSDVLRLQEQDAVADLLGLPDADALMAQVAAAARTIAWTSDEAWDRIDSSFGGPVGRAARRDREIEPGVVLRDEEIAITADADVEGDPVLPLRVAAAAATRGLRIDRSSLNRLAAGSPPLPDPWPADALDRFVQLLRTGRPAIGVVEALDQKGLFTRILPEWETVRSKPQRNAYHRFTVDRHLAEVVAGAAERGDQVRRPDLLVVGALLHDLGKGLPGDHTEVGVVLAEQLGPRLGFDAEDTAVLADMVRYHLLLPDIATRRDLDDPATIRHVAEAVGDVETLHLLAALTEADSLATGPAAWGDWKAGLVNDLVHRTERSLGGGEPGGEETFPTGEQVALMQQGEAAVATDDTLTLVAPDQPRHLSRVAGVVAANGLDVLAAAAHSEGGTALTVVKVDGTPERGWDRVLADLASGAPDLDRRLADRAQLYRRRPSSVAIDGPQVRIHGDASDAATVIEVYAADGVGVLYRLAATLADLGLDIRRALVQTLGDQVVDSFYVCGPDGQKITDPKRLEEIERAILEAVASQPASASQ